MKKEEIYINLQGKTKEELTDLWEFLTSNGEKCYRDKDYFSEYHSTYRTLHLYHDLWRGYDDEKVNNKTEITIDQLKEILQPMDLTIEQRIEKAEAEVKRLRSLIEEQNEIKCGDWYFEISNKVIRRAQNKMTKDYLLSNYNSIKITDQELINKLNELIK